ncbi:MAG: hypothetical protein K5786_00760, partial [Treponema sp.]|nr:hypothetical protein [Treponema sp.]
NPVILKKSEFFEDGNQKGTLRFTWCGTPVTYKLTKNKPCITVNGLQHEGTSLTAAETADLFARNGKIKEIVVEVAL